MTTPQAQVSSPAVSLITFRTAFRLLSKERLASYSLQQDADSTDAAARYLWNMALANAFQPVLHVAEVAFRNAIYRAGEASTSERALSHSVVACWLDTSPSLLGLKEQSDVSAVTRELARTPKRCTPGHLISSLGFGFWVRLCQRPYEQGNLAGPQLWPEASGRGFQYAPKALRNRLGIHTLADRIRDFRNRVAHHNPIWDRDPLKRHGDIIELLRWMSPDLANAVLAASQVNRVVQAGHARYRALAETLISISL